ncbi:hypothetical protein HAX54_027986 [Datura stramonium]|uniref:Zinc finger A20 and AN1 domain-containing stress-associated protein 4 n=1 Tax=Datura stramonium TaxID=4076 RepID=A0ABS8S958_DATST|nr:hypothetical protein [Datura stramonium]
MAEEQRMQEAAGHRLCANNCGFFGSPTTLNLCSKCYKDHCMKEQQSRTAQLAMEKTRPQHHHHHHHHHQQVQSESTLTSMYMPCTSEPLPILKVSQPREMVEDVNGAPQVQLDSTAPEAPRVQLDTAGEASDQVQLDIVAEAPQVQLSIATDQAPQVQSNRCTTCRKRVGLTGFKCRCGVTFCGSHRYPEHHGCTFDYKSMGRVAIAMANPLVKAEKLHKI